MIDEFSIENMKEELADIEMQYKAILAYCSHLHAAANNLNSEIAVRSYSGCIQGVETMVVDIDDINIDCDKLTKILGEVPKISLAENDAQVI